MRSTEIPSRFSTPRRVPLVTILASAPREQAAVIAHVDHGYKLIGDRRRARRRSLYGRSLDPRRRATDQT